MYLARAGLAYSLAALNVTGPDRTHMALGTAHAVLGQCTQPMVLAGL